VASQPHGEPGDNEVVDAVPVLADSRAIEPRRPAPVAVQAAAVAATSFAAGLATIAVVKHRRTLGLRRRRTPAGKVLATRSFLVDVHLLDSKR
jgi:hypothetical protein